MERGRHARLVLIVDDDRSCRELLAATLAAEGIRVATAEDGRAALRAIRRERPDLILLDLEMPRLSGWALFERLAGNPETAPIPVVVLTGVDPRDLVAQTSAILPKPVNIDDLVGEVTRQLNAA